MRMSVPFATGASVTAKQLKKEKENRTDCPVTIPNSRCGFFSKIFQFPGEALEPKRSPHTYFGESVDVSLTFQVPKERLWKNLRVKDA